MGHIVSEAGVHTDPEKVAAVKDWVALTNVKELRSFLRLCSYYCRFVKGLATVAGPLHHLMKKGRKFEWTAETQDFFEKLKKPMISYPVLAYSNPSKPFILDCNANDEGIGGVLSQEHGGAEHAVAYFSKQLTPAEKSYCVIWKELLAVVKCLTSSTLMCTGRVSPSARTMRH